MYRGRTRARTRRSTRNPRLVPTMQATSKGITGTVPRPEPANLRRPDWTKGVATSHGESAGSPRPFGIIDSYRTVRGIDSTPGGTVTAGGEPVPTWLRELAAAARTTEVPAQLRPPPEGGRRSAVLVLFAAGPQGPGDHVLIRGAIPGDELDIQADLAQLGDRPLTALRGAAVDEDVGPRLGELLGHPQSDTSGAAGDEGRLAFEFCRAGHRGSPCQGSLPRSARCRAQRNQPAETATRPRLATRPAP